LKPAECPMMKPPRPVALFTGAWIETIKVANNDAAERVAPFTGAWIETRGRNPLHRWILRRPLHGGVD